MWNEINNQSDLTKFMKLVGEFHDSCIKEMKYTSGAYATKTGLHPINDLRILKMIVQGGFADFDAIEMEFINLKWLNMYPIDTNYTCEILDSTMFFKENCIYWCDEGGLSETDIDNYKGTLICAEKMRWRPANEYIGPDEVYVGKNNN